MIKKLIYHTLLYTGIAATFTLSACSESSLSPIDELGKTIYDPTDAQAGTADAAINDFYTKYGSKILYDFNASDLTFGWSVNKVYWYAPVKDEYKHHIKDVVAYLTETAFQDYPDAFIKKFLPYRIFMVESICESKEFDQNKIKDVLEVGTHGIAVGNVGEAMDNWGEEKWNKLQSDVVTATMNAIYAPNKANGKIVSFEELRPNYSSMLGFADDPLGEFSNIEYPLYNAGYIGHLGIEMDWEMISTPYYSSPADLGQFISFILKTPKSEMDKILNRFNLVKQRTFLVANFIKEDLGMDPIAMQNAACPNDRLPADYFKK